ncbi:hypothetical protein ACFY3G_47005 [Streptomyces phaeochromogenes]|uniref:hypothetical protein n=1 Tax=Streptomyces phaeochromogenes TaxID=1923 RepID=UPI0036CEE79D
MPKVMSVVAVVLGLVVSAVAGCSSSPGSPKQQLIQNADGTCRTINKRFAGDLAYGEGLGAGDASKLRERGTLLKALRDQVRKMPNPGEGQAQLDSWLDKVGVYITGLDDLRGQLQNYRLGMDLVPALQRGVNEDAAKAIGPTAKRFGFEECAKTQKWEYLAS